MKKMNNNYCYDDGDYIYCQETIEGIDELKEHIFWSGKYKYYGKAKKQN